MLILGAFLAWLGLAKQQYGGLAFLLGALVAAACVLRCRIVAKPGLILLSCILSPLAFTAMNSTQGGLVTAADEANRTDTFLWAVLPNAANRANALHILGLPDSCGDAIGTSWYTPGLKDHHPCPAVLTLSRLALPRLFIAQPGTLLVPLVHGTALTQPLRHDDIVRFERPAQALSWAVRAIRETSLSFALARIPPIAYAPLLAAAMACAACLLVPSVWRPTPSGNDFALVAALGGVIIFYSVATSVFGDGYQDIRRHAMGLLIGLPFAISGAMGSVLHGRRAYARQPRSRAVPPHDPAGMERRPATR